MPTAKPKRRALKATKKARRALQDSEAHAEAAGYSSDLEIVKKRRGMLEEGGSHDRPEEGNTLANPVKIETESQAEYIKKLEEDNEWILEKLARLQSDTSFMGGNALAWPESLSGQWPDRLIWVMWWCEDWGSTYCPESRNGKYDHLSKEQKKQIIASMEGYVVQDDFDKLVARFPPHIRTQILGVFAGIILLKEILSIFFSNPFWYMEWPDGRSVPDDETSTAGTPFGALLDCLYQKFLDANTPMARHWKAMTIRLSNSTNILQTENPAFGLHNKALREAQLRPIVAARLADKTFQCLLRDQEDPENPDRREIELTGLYQCAAQLGMDVATAQVNLEWRTLEGLPSKFHHRSLEIRPAFLQADKKDSSRLNGHPVLAVIRPGFWRIGTWVRDGKDRMLAIGHVLVEDPEGFPWDDLVLEGDEAAKKKNEGKKRKRRQLDNQGES